ncbi:MAG TPA: TonB-dependent receptor, partial [Bacteroidia bacterium]|nr:TonB-dependent receptor [Bacteroidia bacterium]
MNIKRLIFITIQLCFSAYVAAQDRVLLSGRVTDDATGETLIGATIINADSVTQGTTTDIDGNYKLYLKPGIYKIRISYIGYKTHELELELKTNTTRNFKLETEAVAVDEVIINAEASDKNVKSIEMSRMELTGKTIKQLPVVFGETDVLKSITLLPGIKSGGEGSTGFYVRGGGPDQNLVLLDDAVVYNASHLLGFFSVFNGDVVDNVEVIKGGMPANYGGRLSSIVNVGMREGDRNKFKVNGGVGLISSRLMLEGPIQREKSSFIISARRTYGDVIARPFLADSIKGNSLYFYDMNAKLSFVLGKKDRLYFTGYWGRDVFRFVNNRVNKFTFTVNWGNRIASVRWNHTYSSRLVSNLSVTYNDYDLKSTAEFYNAQASVYSGLRDVTTKHDYVYIPNKELKVKFGALYINHTFIPGILSAQQSGININQTINRQFAHEGAGYVSVDYEPFTRWFFNAGLRYSVFDQVGPYKQPIYDELGTATGNYVEYKKGTSIKLWHGAEPRFSFRYSVDASTSVKGSYTRTLQYLHLATSSSATLPTDLWVPSSRLVKPQVADQVALGLFKNFKKDEYETSIEAYYKPMQNQIEFKPGAQLFFNQNLENEMVFGSGLSYGVEFFIKKT